jgi:hypothetical protein
MPNVNLLPTITTATSNGAYFVVSDGGLVRRFKLENFVNQLKQNIPDANTTNQTLFTNSNVVFQSLTIKDTASVFGQEVEESAHGIEFEMRGSSSDSVRLGDVLGTFRFGGFDGTNNIISTHGQSAAGITSVALSNWSSSGDLTTNSGASLSLYTQPVNVRLSKQSRVTSLIITSTQTNALIQPTTIVRIGAIPGAPTVQTTSTDGTQTFTGIGRADVAFVNSRLQIVGIPQEDDTAINATLTATNSILFSSGREDTFVGRKKPLKTGDTVGVLAFNGIYQTIPTNDIGVQVANIRVHATCDYSSSARGSSIHFRTTSSATNQMVTSLELQADANKYFSEAHSFRDSVGDGPELKITSGTIVFNDLSIQSTAYQGFTSVPGSSNSSGTIGQMAYDSSYFYICVGTNQWKRIAASDF